MQILVDVVAPFRAFTREFAKRLAIDSWLGAVAFLATSRVGWDHPIIVSVAV